MMADRRKKRTETTSSSAGRRARFSFLLALSVTSLEWNSTYGLCLSLPTGRIKTDWSSSFSSLRASTVASEADSGTDRESPRLRKAKQLLDQFTAEEDPDQQVPLGNIQPSVSISSSGSADPALVPDNYWSNGLLDGSDVVTRYAFRRGVKVAEPLVKYDPVAAEKQLFRQPAKWLIRNVQIAGPIGLWAVGVLSDFVVSQRSNRRQRAIQLRNAISNLGPAIIKAGQALASRPDLLPSEYLEELQKLQDDVPRFSNKIAFETVEKELGVNFDDVFELVEDEPIAAASIGQVYKGRLKANGDVVAIKIQRPNCEEIISLDLYVLRWWSGVYSKIFQCQ